MNRKRGEMGQRSLLDTPWVDTPEKGTFVPLLLSFLSGRSANDLVGGGIIRLLGIIQSSQELPGRACCPGLGCMEGRNWSLVKFGCNPSCGEEVGNPHPSWLVVQATQNEPPTSIFDKPDGGTTSLIHLYIPST